jgi:RimJ/RimL family protein N-acetyltransferase
MSNENSQIIFLRGHKTILRPMEDSDLLRMTRWINDQDILRGLLLLMPRSTTDEREWMEKMRHDKTGIVLAIDTLDGRHIGNIGMHNIMWRDRTAITGILIGEKDFHGKGYAKDAKMQLLHWAFHSLNLRKICSAALEFNQASLNYNLKCGYREEGRRKEQYFRDNRYWDEIMLAVFKEDWEPIWQRYRANPDKF